MQWFMQEIWKQKQCLSFASSAAASPLKYVIENEMYMKKS